jgi:hypothetical protein
MLDPLTQPSPSFAAPVEERGDEGRLELRWNDRLAGDGRREEK